MINNPRRSLWSCNSKTKQKPPLHSNWWSSFNVATQLFHSERASSGPPRQRCSSNSQSYDDLCFCVAKAYFVNSVALVRPHAFFFFAALRSQQIIELSFFASRKSLSMILLTVCTLSIYLISQRGYPCAICRCRSKRLL